MWKGDLFDWAGVVIGILAMVWCILLFLNHVGEIPKNYSGVVKDGLQYTIGPICLFGGLYIGLRIP